MVSGILLNQGPYKTVEYPQKTLQSPRNPKYSLLKGFGSLLVSRLITQKLQVPI